MDSTKILLRGMIHDEMEFSFLLTLTNHHFARSLSGWMICSSAYIAVYVQYLTELKYKKCSDFN
jgi:hypothetical protein